ncbi:unnamed protein product [Symbiodinium sp. KB8]|nr:unnamed protein product [Symbiodinium sp. KB8]
MDVASIADVLAKNVPFFADSLGELHLTPSHETEWHQVYFADDGRHKVVVSIPSWSGTDLYSKTLAEEALSGLGPHHIGTLVHGSHILLVNEFFDGGTLKTEDLTSETLAMVGSLYARLHKADVSWFQPVCEKLLADGVLAKHESDWAFCLWVLPRLLGLVPETNKLELAALGVNWDYIAAEVKSLPVCPELPTKGLTSRSVCVHGDAHLGNIMWHRGELRLIDFDMTAVGPAGADLAYIVLMLFRCGFSPDAILDVGSQQQFVRAYLEASGSSSTAEDIDTFLLEMHCWAYVGLLQMGLLCAVLMHNEGNAAKRDLMRQRGPVLLHPGFLAKAKEVMRGAASDKDKAGQLVAQGLYFATESVWRS